MGKKLSCIFVFGKIRNTIFWVFIIFFDYPGRWLFIEGFIMFNQFCIVNIATLSLLAFLLLSVSFPFAQILPVVRRRKPPWVLPSPRYGSE